MICMYISLSKALNFIKQLNTLTSIVQLFESFNWKLFLGDLKIGDFIDFDVLFSNFQFATLYRIIYTVY